MGSCASSAALISSLMDFVSGVSDRNYTFVMGVIWDGVEGLRGRVGAPFTGGKIHLHAGNTQQHFSRRRPLALS